MKTHTTRPLARFILPALVLAAVACFGLAPTSAARAQGKRGDLLRSSPQVIAAFKEAVAKPCQSTVRVTCDGKDVALGTVVGPDGWILTKFSELKGKIMCKLKDGREREAQVVGVHEAHDLAMLKIAATGLKAVELTDSKVASVGHWLASPGLGDEPVAIGVVSVATRKLPNPGPSATAPAANSGFLGISLDPEEPGAKINRVEPGSGADKAGLKVSDLVLSLDDKGVEDADTLIELVQKYKPGDVVVVRVKRGDKEVELKATLGKRPAGSGRGDFQNALGSQLSNRRTGFPTILQHDSVIKPSDCGGPIVDLDGRVIGINVARAGRTESYAVPSEVILPLMADLMSGKLAPAAKENK